MYSMSSLIIQNKFFLFLLFVGSFLVRAGVFYSYLSQNNRYWQVDSKTYDLVAQSIVQGNGISQTDGSPHFYRLPGYSIFLAICYYFFGYDHQKALWIQIFLASSIPLLIFFLALVLFPAQLLIAKSAAVYSLFHLGLVLYSSFFMTESLFLFFFLFFLIFFLSVWEPFFIYKEAIKKNFFRFFTAAGFFLGIASLIRPVGHYLVVFSLLLILLSNDRLRSKCTSATVFFVGWLIPVSGWLIRNFILTGYLFFHTLPGGHFLYLSAARVAMHAYDVSYQKAREFLHEQVECNMNDEEVRKGRPLHEIERCQVHEQLAIRYFKMRPLITLKNWLTDIVRATFSLYSAELLYLENERQEVDYFARDRNFWSMLDRYLFPRTSSIMLRIIVYGEIFCFFFMLLGCVLFLFQAVVDVIKKRNFKNIRVVFKTLPFITLFIVIALAGGYARMRLPIEPLLIILACASWGSWIRTFL